ncbi:tetratricopeptide (TPR) repeat protein [Virgibacillus natechei]|uniref:Tetratricopeptide (TPR) repeat protein n=1 Tax=Virgibacillus natechei TaxID=1216297 RepID=A0ABS4IHJ6_9BACI|nr:helix-turn-helix domain-containing protein [Virgibacillus natechei]MBP1970413.1 tetratricopeptide (TPR) repeat protein [Virgibacillus natechei]UZD13931.1 helix-turn-helix domain-containing protein [Virgibacillus natechei]
MIEIGSFIKLQRQKQEMTQGDLAKGIVSLSYLSKIENKKTEASREIIQLICTRLGIQLDNELDTTIQEKCKQWYSMLFEVHDKEQIITTYREVQGLMDTNLTNNLLMFEIHKIRYYLVLGKFDNALDKINELKDVSNTFDNLHQFYWYKFRGNYSSLNGDFNEAMRLYKIAEDKISQIELEDKEIADLQYIIAVTHSKLRNTLESIDYAEKALDIYMKEYNFMRCAQSHIVLGISYRRIKMYEKAIKNYNLARHLGELNNDKQVIQLTNLNLGYLYSAKGNKKDAIHYYLEVADDLDVEMNARLTAVTALIKDYYSINNFDETKQMIDKGFELIDMDNSSEAYKSHYYVLNTFSFAINQEKSKFESIVIDEFIPYLKKHKDHANLVIYANMLGVHFEELNRYKESVKYYKLANLTYEELINI